MDNQTGSKSEKRSKKYRDRNKKQKVHAVVDASSILKHQQEQVNNVECVVVSSESNNQSVSVDNLTNACSAKSNSEFDLNSSVSSLSKEIPESNELREWIKNSNVPYTEVDKLLVILRKRLIPSLPNTTTFLESNQPAESFRKMELDALQDTEAEKNDDAQDFMFIDMSQKPYSGTFEFNDSDIGLQILELLKENSQRLSRIEERQNQLIKYITNKKLADVSEVSLETMYDLQIPMTSFEKFDVFEKQLNENQLFHTDVCARLATCIDRKDCSLSKSFTNMFRTFMSKDLVVKFTATRKSTKGNKRQFNSTILYKLMTGVLIKSRKERNLSHDMKDLMTALSEVISHATQWNV